MVTHRISHVNWREEIESLARFAVPLALFLSIGIFRLYTNILDTFDAIDLSIEVPFVWNTFYILIYATIFFGPVMYWWGRKKEGMVLAALLSGAGIAGLLSKEVFKLPRPFSTAEPGYGYPSFHAQVSVIGWGYLTKYAGYGIAVMPVITGISRICCGDHFFTDVVGGWLLGIGSLYCSHYLERIPVPESVWKRWAIIFTCATLIYSIGYNVEHIPLVLGLLTGFFAGCSTIKKSWEPVTIKKGITSSALGILISIAFLLSVVVLPQIVASMIAGLWMSVCPLLFAELNLLRYSKG